VHRAPTTIDPKLRSDQKIIEARIENLFSFMEFYEKLPAAKKYFEHMSIEQIVVAMEAVTNPQDPATIRRNVVDFMVGSKSKMTPEEYETALKEAWKKTGYTDELPPERKKEEKPTEPKSESKPKAEPKPKAGAKPKAEPKPRVNGGKRAPVGQCGKLLAS
ncbi:MAG: hypothetical protein ABL958_21315, partial [Bdellovibrionia bacterium]